jgi:hypothetical protein
MQSSFGVARPKATTLEWQGARARRFEYASTAAEFHSMIARGVVDE